MVDSELPEHLRVKIYGSEKEKSNYYSKLIGMVHLVFLFFVVINFLFLFLSYLYSTWFLILSIISIPILSLIGYWIKDHFNSKDEKKSKKLKKQIDSEGLSGVEQGGRFVIECLILLFFNFILSLIFYFTFDIIIQGIPLGLSLFIIQISLIIVWVYKDYK